MQSQYRNGSVSCSKEALGDQYSYIKLSKEDEDRSQTLKAVEEK